MTSNKQILQLIQQRKVEFLDCRFLDFPGMVWQQTTFPAGEVSVESFENGFGFDGSSIRGWQAINEGDMLLVPDASTAKLDPFAERPTLSVICDIKDPVTRKMFSRDPRSIAKKAEQYLRETGVADSAYFGPELEFFVFDRVRFDQSINSAVYEVDSAEGVWNRGGAVPGAGYHVRQKEGYFPTPPTDTLHGFRNEVSAMLVGMGVQIESHHHEVATGGQCEIDLRYDTLLNMADTVMLAKHVIRTLARRHGKVATFMPKPLFGDNGSGMHTHFSLWKEEQPLFPGRKYGGLSQQAMWAIGGILKHARSLIAFTNPTTNSFKRLVPGYEAPVSLVYSSRNRASAIRIPQYQNNPATKRVEFRCPDPSANPYLAFSAMVMAALDGIEHQIDPGDPVDVDLTELDPVQLAVIPTAPGDLNEALDALEQDHAYLLAGDVFTEDVIRYWVRYKRQYEVGELRARPHPYEFCMYFDV